jgi:hypothetical protein
MTAEPQVNDSRHQPYQTGAQSPSNMAGTYPQPSAHNAAPLYQGPGLAPAGPPTVHPAGQAPGVGPVILFTALFGVLGAISASNRAKKAAAVGAPTRPYWLAFVATLAVELVLFVILTILVLAGAITIAATAGTVTSSSLESSIVQTSEFKSADGSTVLRAVKATCTASQVDPDGVGTYRCMIDFADQSRQSYVVTVDSSGNWITDSGGN